MREFLERIATIPNERLLGFSILTLVMVFLWTLTSTAMGWRAAFAAWVLAISLVFMIYWGILLTTGT